MKNTKIGIIAIMVILMCSCARSGDKNYEEEKQLSENVMNDMKFEKESMSNNSMSIDEGFEEESVSTNLTSTYLWAANSTSAYLPFSPKTYISSSAAIENQNDTNRNMIRTVNIRFKVKDVIKATYEIENIVVNHNGFVENTNLESRINSTKETFIKEDSVLVTTYYSVLNTLILRVPNTRLDATLKEIAQFVDFMDYRIINVKDVTLDLLSKKLEQNRLAKYNGKMRNAVDNKGKRLNDVTDAEDNMLYKQQQADEAKLASLQILDKIKFSTITLSLYQNQDIKYEVIAKEKNIKSYSIPFGTRFMDALAFGWTIIVGIFLFLIHIWSIILIAVLALLGVKYFKKRKKRER